MEAALVEPSPRLRAVADAVPPGAAVADVGTDHAQLLAWLRARGRIARGIGIDVATGPLQQAARTLAAAGVDGIELRHGDGLAPLRPGEVDTVVLAGMGGHRMMRLCEASPQVVAALDRVVLQPNTDWTAVRRWLMQRRWPLRHEHMVEDRRHVYVVLVVEPRPGEPVQWSDDELWLGPRLCVERPPVFVRWLERELARVERARARAGRGRDATDARVLALDRHRERLRRALAP